MTAQVLVTAQNDPPTLTSFSAVVDTTAEDTEVEITLADLKAQGDEADVDGTVDAFVVKGVSTGTLAIGTSAGTATAWAATTNDTIDATNHAYWTPATDANGTQNAFEVVAQDNLGAESAGNVTAQVLVTAQNDPPVNVVPGTQTVAEEAPTAIVGLSIGDVDAGNLTTRLEVTAGGLSVTLSGSAVISAGSNGTGDLTIQGSVADINATLASLQYTGDTDVVGTAADTLTVTTDDLGNTGSGGAQQVVDGVQIDITPVNDNTPVADAESFSVVEGGTATQTDLDAGSSLLDGDVDLDLPNDTLSVNTTPVAGPAFGSLVLNTDGTFSYTHDGSENHSDTFTYQVSDAVGNADTATVTITITPPNATPVATDDEYVVDEDATLTRSSGAGVLANDSDADGDLLSANLVSGPSDGTLIFNTDGSFAYTPDANFHGSDSFSYRVRDPSGATDTATATIAVDAINDAPAANGETYAVDSDETLFVEAPGLLANDTDVEAEPLAVILASEPEAGTLIVGPDGSFTYSPNPNFDGIVSFEYAVGDGSSESNLVTVTIEVQGVFGSPGQQPVEADPPSDEGDSPPEEDSDTDHETDNGDEGADAPAFHPPPAPAVSARLGSRSGPEQASTEQVGLAAHVMDPIASSGHTDQLAGSAYSWIIDDYVPHRVRQTVESLGHAVGPVGGYIDATAMWDVLDGFQTELTGSRHVATFTAGSVAVASLTMTAGYVFWTLKGGYLLASMMSSLPAWRFMDPLPILDGALASGRQTRADEGESVDIREEMSM